MVSIEPPTQNAAPNAAVKIGIQDLAGAAVQMVFDGGQPFTPAQTDAGGGVTLVTFQSAALFDPASSHSVNLTYGTKTLAYGFSVVNYVSLGAGDRVEPAGVDTSKPGFKLKVYQTATTSIGDNKTAEKVLAGQGGANIANLSAATDGLFDVAGVINFEATGTDAGNMPGDTVFPGIPGTLPDNTQTTDNFAVEAIAFLDLAVGAYTVGVNSDDGFKLGAASNPRDVTAPLITAYDAPRGAGGESVGFFAVTQSGIYPFRLLYWQQSGGAEVEWYVIDTAGNRTLINDPNAPGGSRINSYRQLKAGASLPPYVSAASPAPGEVNVSVRPRIAIDVTEDATIVDQSSIKLALNGSQATLPVGAIVKNGKVTTVNYSVSQPLVAQTAQMLHLEFSDSAGHNVVREWGFTTGKGGGGNLLNSVKGYWTFEKGNLKARVGRDLLYVDDSLASRYKFGVSGQGDFAALPPINGKPAHALLVPYVTDGTHKQMGLRMKHDIAPNGGGQKVNQYTVILDLLWGQGSAYGALWQLHDLDNAGDSDMYWQESSGAYGKTCCSA
ncbi:MAG: hypothetical protein DME21_14640, partial [Verrucomicrobia bacterium]